MRNHNDKMPGFILNNKLPACPITATFAKLSAMHPKELSIKDFNYHLPPERIAQEPLALRGQSRLLIYDDGQIDETVFANIAASLPENAILVFNDTRVIHARILFRNENDATIEVFLLEPVSPYQDLQQAMQQTEACTWRCFVGNAKKWREDSLSKKIKIDSREVLLTVNQDGKAGDDYLVHFAWTPSGYSFAKVLEAAGFVPLPPYIKRKAEASDEQRYQTVYAAQDGSVAAPTAGLHFTPDIIEAIKLRKVQPLYVTLHVSAGTFLPVKAQQMKDHPMHGEQFVIRKATLEALIKNAGAPVIAVGTTTCRTLESLYWLGKKIAAGNKTMNIAQWEPYEQFGQPDVAGISNITMHQALEAILAFMDTHDLTQLTANTSIIIAPGYSFKITDALITNFHLPGSTLLMLVAALIGDKWKEVYQYALEHEFRFLSYGDSSLLWRNQPHGVVI